MTPSISVPAISRIQDDVVAVIPVYLKQGEATIPSFLILKFQMLALALHQSMETPCASILHSMLFSAQHVYHALTLTKATSSQGSKDQMPLIRPVAAKAKH